MKISDVCKLLTLAIFTTCISVCVRDGWAQQKNKISFEVPAENSKYTQNLSLDVGDMQGHQIRIFEIHRTLPKDGPRFAGVRLTEFWSRGEADAVDGNGSVFSYLVYKLENGDEIFGKLTGTEQRAGPQSEGRSSVVCNIILTGGTGEFLGIHGLLHFTSVGDTATGFNKSKTEGEYWIDTP
jgi:hypothetical protein